MIVISLPFLGEGECVVIQPLVPPEVRLVWRRFALFNAEELAVSFAGPLGLPWWFGNKWGGWGRVGVLAATSGKWRLIRSSLAKSTYIYYTYTVFWPIVGQAYTQQITIKAWFFCVLGKMVVTWERGFEWLGFLRWFQKMTFVGENDVCINIYIVHI